MSVSGRTPDGEAVRRAASRTALQVALVSTAIVLVILGLAAGFTVERSRPSELLEAPLPGQHRIYVDTHELLLALTVIGVLAIALVGAASWLISRRSTTPLGTALRLQREFVGDAGHELRTPLAVLDARLQVLQRTLERGEDYRRVLVAVRDDTRLMTAVVTDLLLMAEVSTTSIRDPSHDGCDVRAVLLAAADDISVLAAHRAVTVDAQALNEARVGLNEVSLRRCIVALLDNAVAHSPDGAVVTATATLDRDRAVIRVADRGSGVVGIEPDRIFDRFAHEAHASGSRRAGFGIGLALVRDLATRHGGRVLVESTSNAGTTMRFELPIARTR